MPLELFYSYSHKDSALRDELEVHLKQLVRDGLITPWADRCIPPGSEWGGQIDEHVHSAHIILLLISPDFLASDYCYSREMRIALERQASEHTVVVPIILRPCDWHSAPFARLQALPRQGLAITLWPNRDEVMAQIAQSLRDLAVRFGQTTQAAAKPAMPEELGPQPRMVDAAIPARIVKDRATELLVLVRMADSPGLAGLLQQDEEAEARPEDVRSKPFEVTFPLGPTGRPEPLKLTIQLTSPDFEPPAQSRNIFVPVARDSPVCHFLLTPKKSGALLVVIELLWEDAERGSRRLRTTCIAEAEASAAVPLNIVQMPVGVSKRAALDWMESTGAFAPLAVGAAASIGSGVFPAAASPPAPVSTPKTMPPEARAFPSVAAISRPNAAKSGGGTFKVISLALCLFVFGSTLVYFRTAKPAKSPDNIGIQMQINTAEQELSSRVHQGPATIAAPAEVAAAVKQGQQSLSAAKAALSRGDRKAAQKHLAAALATNQKLVLLEKRYSQPSVAH